MAFSTAGFFAAGFSGSSSAFLFSGEAGNTSFALVGIPHARAAAKVGLDGLGILN